MRNGDNDEGLNVWAHSEQSDDGDKQSLHISGPALLDQNEEDERCDLMIFSRCGATTRRSNADASSAITARVSGWLICESYHPPQQTHNTHQQISSLPHGGFNHPAPWKDFQKG